MTLSTIAAKYGRSRQRVHQWLQDHNLLDQCEKLESPTGKTAQLLIPLAIVARMPFSQVAENTEEKK